MIVVVDPGAVVDPQLRVHGISGLRVADASVMPLIVNAPLHPTVLAVRYTASSRTAAGSFVEARSRSPSCTAPATSSPV